jgi:hypothetical protein
MRLMEKRIADLEHRLTPETQQNVEIIYHITEPILGPDGLHERGPNGACKTRHIETVTRSQLRGGRAP